MKAEVYVGVKSLLGFLLWWDIKILLVPMVNKHLTIQITYYDFLNSGCKLHIWFQAQINSQVACFSFPPVKAKHWVPMTPCGQASSLHCKEFLYSLPLKPGQCNCTYSFISTQWKWTKNIFVLPSIQPSNHLFIHQVNSGSWLGWRLSEQSYGQKAG